MLDKILERVGLKYDDLTNVETEYLLNQIEALKNNQITVEAIRNNIAAMRRAVEEELTKHDLGTKQDLFLKARLRNYMLLEAFMDTPENAQKALENALQGIVGRK